MRLLLVCALAMGLAGPVHAQAKVGSPINIDASVNFNDLLDQIGKAVLWVTGRATDKSDSVAVLATRLNELAGNEEALAQTLEWLAVHPEHLNFRSTVPESRARMNRLEDHIADIQRSIIEIRRSLSRIEPNWAMHNGALTADIGAFAHDGKIFYLTPDGSMESLQPDEAKESAVELRREAAELRKLAKRIAAE
ncbi:hypothetical protein [Caulobacter vibrioides]|uniref:hypothetical protein n=1 Tax=Caulobacter vibrioides TaxID=155892 RepID=UPI000BB45834|nr:hypothetical protein [Caulobacter vibrioides]ATC25818.1 hypothetical protein CA608_15415 [Caulobacter vibrioides]PLR13603.1 hypothetical protein CVUC_06485 [Caulobacter vibrioides]